MVRIRHKAPEGTTATEAAFGMAAAPAASFDAAVPDFQFAYAVAAFADVLRGADDAKGWSLDRIAEVARAAANGNADRSEFVALVMKARALRGTPSTVAR
jgi:Ca-activated chloride channel family protein